MAPKFNYLKNNESAFPNVENVNVFKFDNNFDYARYNYSQMKITVCSVPWDMGEAHIGNRTISGIGNVVYFGSKEKRDAWFADIPDNECYRFETKYKELHRDHVIDVPIPFDMVSKHNYLIAEYNLFANDDSPVMYEGENGHRKWFWFIREVEFLAPNTTRLHLLDDAFQTWIYDINVSGMMLERGHAPMFKTKADTYLKNPIENNAYLLTEDVNFGTASQVKNIDACVLNDGTVYACIATTANPTGTWTNKVPASAYYVNDGAPSVYVFAVQAANLNTLLSNIDSTYPQFKQTIQAVFFASNKLVTLANPFTFCSVNCYGLSAGRKTLNLTELTKSQFGYDTQYSNIAKLYTSPYAHLEITDENGNVDIVKIEDTTGTIKLSAAMSLAYPFITIDAQLTGVGGSATKTVTFKNISSHEITIQGQWYETLKTWQVPTFLVVLDPAKEYDYSTNFERAQRVVDYTAAKNNAYDSADLVTDNASLQVAANNAVTSASNASVDTSVNVTQTNNQAMNAAANYIIGQNATSSIDAQEQQATIGAVSSVVNGATGAIASASTGNVAGAIAGAIGGLVGAGATMANMSVATALTATQASNAQLSNDLSTVGANAKTGADGTVQKTAASEINSANNSYISGSAANTSATQKAIANRNQSAAQSGITNDVAQAALRAPFIYGSASNGDTAVTKPIGLFSHVVTQSKAAIESAGDEFLRYGYMLDRFWEFDGNWNIGKYFTYWKLKDFWVTNLNVPDMYMDKIRFFLFGGVTVWRDPNDIGKISIYENFA